MLVVTERTIGFLSIKAEANPLRHNFFLSLINGTSRVHSPTIIREICFWVNVTKEKRIARFRRDMNSQVFEIGVPAVLSSLAEAM